MLEPMLVTIIYSRDHEYGAYYFDETLMLCGDSEYVDPIMLWTSFRSLELEVKVLEIPNEAYDIYFNGEGFPLNLSDNPLDKFEDKTQLWL